MGVLIVLVVWASLWAIKGTLQLRIHSIWREMLHEGVVPEDRLVIYQQKLAGSDDWATVPHYMVGDFSLWMTLLGVAVTVLVLGQTAICIHAVRQSQRQKNTTPGEP